jgi:hypothetical protein
MNSSGPNLERPVQYLFEATKVIIPVITGFLVVFGGTAVRVWDADSGMKLTRLQWISGGAAVLFGDRSLGSLASPETTGHGAVRSSA